MTLTMLTQNLPCHQYDGWRRPSSGKATLKHGFFTAGGGISRGVYNSLNCGYGSGISVKQVAAEFARQAKKKVMIKIVPKRKGDLVKIVALTKKLKKFIKWKPKFNRLEIMVKSSIKWERSL